MRVRNRGGIGRESERGRGSVREAWGGGQGDGGTGCVRGGRGECAREQGDRRECERERGGV